MPETCIAIGDLRAAIETGRPDTTALVQARYAGFRTTAAPQWRVTIDVGEPGAPSADLVVTRNGSPRRLEVAWHDFRGTVDLAARTAHVRLGLVDGMAVENFLRVTWSLALPRMGAVLLHSAGLVRGGRAYVFAGPSGAGKTTIARLTPDAVVLSDELTVVSRSGSVSATPFWGELAGAAEDRREPLRGLYFVEHGDRHLATRLGRREALPALLANVLYRAREPELVGELLDVAAAVVEAVPCFRLTFRRDAGFWEAIHGT